MKLPAFVFLFLSSVAVSSAHADTGEVDGRWRGTYSSPSSENAIDLRVEESAGLHEGHLDTAGSATSFPIENLGGEAIRIVVPNLGIFEGQVRGNVLEGTFTGASGTGSFRLDRAPEPDFQQMFVD
jgi:hypothetical protein